MSRGFQGEIRRQGEIRVLPGSRKSESGIRRFAIWNTRCVLPDGLQVSG